MSEQPNLREVGSRIEQLLQELLSAADPAVRDRAEELVGRLVELYGAGLERIVAVTVEGEATGRDLLDRLASDDLVASLLILHGLHPRSTAERVRQALDRVGPRLGSGAALELIGIDDAGAARLRLGGGCDGSPLSPAARAALEGAVQESAPEVVTVEIEGPPAAPALSVFIPATSIRHRDKPQAPSRGHAGSRPAEVRP